MNNTSEAKVPNDEGNWQSIEIYLFSNGQQYSPPRKYHLQAEELNWWEDTLNHLARSHYGIQHPLIYLYTIDGRLVEGPLELKDGQAYVAVEPPATFIDAGYQKYLIRATRSWERRQAKKKSQVCDQQQPCCTCPDKDCQLHGTCCLCPERERAVSLEPLLPAIPQRNSPYGHYVSSGHGKPIPPDTPADNGKATSRDCGGGRVSERRPSPCEQAMHSGFESGREENDLTSTDRGPRGGEHHKPSDNDIPNKYEAKLDESEVRPDVHRVQSGESEILDDEHTVDRQDSKIIDNSSARSSEHTTGPNDHSTSPDKEGHLAPDQKAKPTIYDAQLGEKEPGTTDVAPKLDDDVPKTEESETSSDEGRGRLDEDAVKLTEQRLAPINQATDKIRSSKSEPERDQDNDDDYGPVTVEREAKIPEPGEKVSADGPKFQENSTKSDQRRSVTGESGSKTGEHVPATLAVGKSHRLSSNSNKIKEDSGHTGPKLTDRGSRQDSGKELGELVNKSEKYPNTLGEHTGKSNENDDSSWKNKRISKEIQDKHYESNNALGEQEEKVSENKRQDSKLERDPSVDVQHFLSNDPSVDDSLSKSTGSATKMGTQINNIDKKQQDSLDKAGVIGGREATADRARVSEANRKEHRDKSQRQPNDQENRLGELGTKGNEYVAGVGDLNKIKNDRAEMEHANKRSEPGTVETGQDDRTKETRAIQNQYDSDLSEERYGEHDYRNIAEKMARDGNGEKPKTRQQRHSDKKSEEGGGVREYTSKVVPQRTEEAVHHLKGGETKAKQKENRSGMNEEMHKEREYANKVKNSQHETASDGREVKPKLRHHEHAYRVSEDRDGEQLITRNGELKSEEPGHDSTGEEARARQQKYDKGALEEEGRGHEHGTGSRETRNESRDRIDRGETRTISQDHGGRASEEKSTHRASRAGKQRDGQTLRVDTDGEPRSTQQGHAGKARTSEERGGERDYIRDGEQKSGDASHDRRGGKVRSRQHGRGSRGSDEIIKEREYANRTEDTESNGREREPKAEQLEHGVRASEERRKEQECTKAVVPQRSGGTDHHVRRGEASDKRQEHKSGASGEISKERKYSSRAEDIEPIIRQQGHRTKTSENRGEEHDITRDMEQRTGRESRDLRAKQQELSGALEGRLKERGYGSKTGEQRARESAHSSGTGYPKVSNKERGGRASDERSKASKGSPQKTEETGYHGKREARVSQQEHVSRPSDEIIKEREYAIRASKDHEHNDRNRQQRKNKEHGRRASEDRGREKHVTRNGEQMTKEAVKTGQKDHGNGVLDQKGRELGHESRAGEIECDGRKKEPRTIQQRHGVRASIERGKEHDVTRDGEQRTKETGHGSRGAEAIARPQDNGNRASGEKSRNREHGSKAGEQRAGVSGHSSIKGVSRASRKESGGVETDERGKEPEFASKISPQRTRESDHRPRRKDQRTRQSDPMAKVGHEIRVGDHEARAGDFSVRASNNGARLSNPNSRSAETSARSSTPGARANPRDRNNPRARMGEPRLGLPAVRTDEPGQIGVIENPDEPKIRAGNVESVAIEREMGGAGAARVPHISEAQQHVRNSNATEGRTSTEKQRSSAFRRPTPFPISTIPPRKSEDKKLIKTNKDVLQRKLSGKAPVLVTNENEKNNIKKVTAKYPSKSIVPTAVPPPTTNFNQIPLKSKSTSLTKVMSNHKSLLTDSGPIDNAIGNNEIIVVSTNLFRNQESEITSMRLDSVKHAVDGMEDFPDDITKLQQNIPSICVNEGVQTLTELVSEADDKHGHAVSSCKSRGGCMVSSQRDNMVATDDPKENFISILNKGDVVNLKLNIEVRNDQSKRPVNFCQKSCRKSRSLTNITRTEKCSQISIDDDVFVQSKSLQSLLNNEYFRGSGPDGRPKIFVVQCACCGRPNNSPRCDPPRCSDSKKYFVLLPNPQDKDDRCNCESHCQSNSHKIHLSSQKSTSENTVKKTYSNMSLETVMVRGVSTQRREVARYVATTNSACQTEEPRSESLIGKHKVSITENSGIRCEVQKESYSQISVVTPGLASENNCTKTCPQIRSQTSGSKHVDPHVCTLDSSNPYAKVQAQLCPEVCPDTCPLAPLHACQHNCSQIVPQTQGRPFENYQGYSKAYSQVQSQGSSQTFQQVQSQGFSPACHQVQSKACSNACASSQSQRLTHSQGSRQACPPVHLQVRSQTCTQGQSNCFPQAQSQEQSQVCNVTCPQDFPQVCPQIYLQVQSQVCPPTCLQAQSQTCPQTSSQGFPAIRREVSDSHTQTQWCSVLLEARLHDDGRYSFHLPPLQVLKYYSF